MPILKIANTEAAGRDELCGRSTTRRCPLCRAVVCKGCDQEHLEEKCSMANFRLCAVCGTALRTSACDRCGTPFCERHSDHDCATPRSGDRGTGRETGLGLVRRELERGLAGSESMGRSKSKITVRMDAPGDWDRNEEVRLSLATADAEAWRMRQLGGPQFMSGPRTDVPQVPLAVGGGSLVGIPMSRDGNRPCSWANPNLIREETGWVESLLKEKASH